MRLCYGLAAPLLRQAISEAISEALQLLYDGTAKALSEDLMHL